MKRILLSTCLAAAVGVFTSPVAAQFYIPPQCDIDTKHFLVKQAELYVKAAAEAKTPEQASQAATDAERVLLDALNNREEAGNPGVWYFLARAYGLKDDLHGADSAFTRVESMMPDCVDDVDTHRNMLWVPVYNAAVQALQTEDQAAARENLSKANVIYHKEPFVPYYLASVFSQQDERDSAIVYFKQTLGMLEAPIDSQYTETFNVATFNVARLHHQGEEWDSAAVYYEKYNALNPDDEDGVRGLAAAYEGSGQTEKAAALMAGMLSDSENMSSTDLFSVGVSMFQANNYTGATEAFTLGLEKNPYHRDGLYNLGQSYYAIASPDEEADTTEPSAEELTTRTEAAASMLEIARKLGEFDPYNESSLQMLAAAWQLAGDDDSTLAVIEALNAIPFDVSITGFSETDAGFDLQGTIRNTKTESTDVTPIKFEFYNAAGETVATETFAVTTLEGEATTDFHFTPVGEGIISWRYFVQESD